MSSSIDPGWQTFALKKKQIALVLDFQGTDFERVSVSKTMLEVCLSQRNVASFYFYSHGLLTLQMPKATKVHLPMITPDNPCGATWSSLWSTRPHHWSCNIPKTKENVFMYWDVNYFWVIHLLSVCTSFILSTDITHWHTYRSKQSQILEHVGICPR